MKNELYLIDKKTYMNHLQREMILYSMIDGLTDTIFDLPSNRGSKALCDEAYECYDKAREMVQPLTASYRAAGGDIEKLILAELVKPSGVLLSNDEDYADEDYDDYDYDMEDDECDEDDDEFEAEADEEDSEEVRCDNVELFNTMAEALWEATHKIFGDGVKITINVDK